MRVIGLLGGMSWESSAEYYRLINQGVRARLGGLHSARCLMWSFDFADVERLQRAGDWAQAERDLVDAARRLESAGADFLLICANTMHKLAPAVEAAVGVPVLHIADAAGERVKAAGLRRVGLLGTAFTMEQDFYSGRLQDRHGLEILIPEAEDRRTVHRIIYEELVVGRIEEASRQAYREVIDRLHDRGAEAIVLGCTEIPMLVRPQDSVLPLFDTTAIHAEAAVSAALETAGETDAA